MKILKMLLVSTILTMLVSCGSVECLQYVRTEEYVWNDTIEIPSLHCHHYNEVTDSIRCIYIPEFRCEIVDTICIDLYEIKKVKKRHCYE